MSKKFILNADDFGMSQNHNRAVLCGCNDGFLKSASICANGPAFDSAVNEILPECQNLGLGVHLNIIEGKPLTNCFSITDNAGNFNCGYLGLISRSQNKDFLKEIEREFRAQIEKIMSCASVDHIDSHVHTHAIPPIFRLTCKLAKEYGIPFVRTQHEEFYTVPGFKKHFNLKYPPNILKIILLNFYTAQNIKTVKEYGLKTNDYLIGVGYTGMMDAKTLEYGLKALEGTDLIAEALIHPCKYSSKKADSHTEEFAITQDKMLQDTIYRLGFEITNYKNIK